MSATRLISRSLLATFRHSLTPSSSAAFQQSLRPLSALSHFRSLAPAALTRAFSTRPATTSLSDPNPNWSNRPPKETILLDGCDFEHWLVVVDKPEGDATRDDIIEGYIKTLAKVVGSEEEARMKIYSVSTRHYFAFGALVSEELSYKLKELPGVRWVLPDSYLDVKNKDYGGEPFINGQAVPYDPKYHEEWVRNNARANERNRKNDRPRNFDRSRNFERRDAQGPPPPPRPNMGAPPQGNMGPNMGGPPQGNMGPNMGGHPQGNMGPNMGGPPMGGMPPRMPPNNMGGQPNYNAGPNMGGMPPQGGGMPPNNMGNPPNYNAGPNMGGYPNNQQNPNYGNGPINGGAPFQSGPNPNQNNFAPNNANPYQNQNLPGRDYQ